MEAIIAALEVIPEPFKSMATTLVEVCAYAGTGNVLKIQHLLHICSEHHEPSEKVGSMCSIFILYAIFNNKLSIFSCDINRRKQRKMIKRTRKMTKKMRKKISHPSRQLPFLGLLSLLWVKTLDLKWLTDHLVTL